MMSKKPTAHRRSLRKIILVVVIPIVITIGSFLTFNNFVNDSRDTHESALLHTEGASLLFETLFAEKNADVPDGEQESSAAPMAAYTTYELDLLRDRLIRYDDLHEDVYRSYVLIHSGEEFIVLSDSKPSGSPLHLSEGSVCDLTQEAKQTLLSSKTISFNPDGAPDTLTVLTPMIDENDGSLDAVFGIDYSVPAIMRDTWRHLQNSIEILVIFLLLLVGIYYAVTKNESLRDTAARLRESEKRFRDVFEQAPIGIAIVSNYTDMKRMNRELRRILGREEEDNSSIRWEDITYPEDLSNDRREFERFKNGEISGYSMDKRYVHKDGTPVWVSILVTGLRSTVSEENLTGVPEHICIVQDIGKKKEAEDALKESERSKAVLLSNIPGMAYRCQYDKDWTMLFMSDGCFELTGYKQEEMIGNRNMSFNDIIAPEYQNTLWNEWAETLAAKTPIRSEYEIICKNGERKWVLEIGRGIFGDNDTVEALEGIIVDITESKRNLEKIRYMNDHDFMTGLYNRKHFEEEKARFTAEDILPISVLNADINGVRLINDAFGQATGDMLIKKTAEIILKCCKEGDVLARTGGDEFTVLLPNADAEEADRRIGIVLAECELYNAATEKPEQKINLTIASGTRSHSAQSLDDAEKEADDAVRKRKLFERGSTHSSLLASILATLYARSQETEEHAERIAALCKEIGLVLELPQKSLDNLQLFSMLHDIGKIGIEDRILNKPGKLTDDEWIVMRQHPEIGFRIVMSAPELEAIAQLVLSHHERWDGRGYPRGLKGEEIPQVARILSVVDAYDAMTEDRVYRKAMTKGEAVEEIKKNSGTQFDPKIVRIFLDIMDVQQTTDDSPERTDT